MKYYAGIDLHSNNSYVTIIDELDKVVYQKRLTNDLEIIEKALSPYQAKLEGVVVESTYNWYWLVDALQAKGYTVHLGNTAKNSVYKGLKHTDDKSDAIWLAHLLRLGLLATGYIYQKEERSIREMLRRRMILVRQQTSCLLGIQALIVRYENVKVSGYKIKSRAGREEEILCYVEDDYVRLAVSSQLKVLYCLLEQIKELEQSILSVLKKNRQFDLLQTVPGIGQILAMTILLEVGTIKRFKSAGNFSSYCRCVKSERISNDKKKSENNRKNGNHYLAWAFIEASNSGIRYSPSIKRYYQKKLAKTKRVIALKAIANKLSKACYFMLRDNVEFDMKKAFS